MIPVSWRQVTLFTQRRSQHRKMNSLHASESIRITDLLDQMTGGYTFAVSPDALYTGLNFVLSTKAGTLNGQMAGSLNPPLGFGYAATGLHEDNGPP